MIINEGNQKDHYNKSVLAAAYTYLKKKYNDADEAMKALVKRYGTRKAEEYVRTMTDENIDAHESELNEGAMIRPFNRSDWQTYSGASFLRGSKSPMIYDGDTGTVIMAGTGFDQEAMVELNDYEGNSYRKAFKLDVQAYSLMRKIANELFDNKDPKEIANKYGLK